MEFLKLCWAAILWMSLCFLAMCGLAVGVAIADAAIHYEHELPGIAEPAVCTPDPGVMFNSCAGLDTSEVNDMRGETWSESW